MVIEALMDIVGEEKVKSITKVVEEAASLAVTDTGISPAAICLVIYSLEYNLIARAAADGNDEVFDTIVEMLTSTHMEAMLFAVSEGADEVIAMRSMLDLLKDSGIDLSK